MQFSRDMDEVIIDGCKLHGPKDRTFSRIAKQIGGVTDKQVIFLCPVSKLYMFRKRTILNISFIN